MLLAFPALAPLLLIAPALLAQAPGAPTVEAILARHLAARGGLAKIKAIQSLTSTGRVEVGPMVLTLHIENPRRGSGRPVAPAAPDAALGECGNG